jgi:hypothetical protein
MPHLNGEAFINIIENETTLLIILSKGEDF